MAENKTKPTSASVDDFIAGIENRRRHSDALISKSCANSLPATMRKHKRANSSNAALEKLYFETYELT